MQTSNFENVLKKLVQLKGITDGDLGAGPPAVGGFGDLGAKPPAVRRLFVSFWKKSYFNAIESHFASVQSHLKALDFWHLKGDWKNQIV